MPPKSHLTALNVAFYQNLYQKANLQRHSCLTLHLENLIITIMKKTIYPILAFSGLLAMSCSNDTETGVAGDTRLVVDLGTDLSFSTSGEPAPAKRAIDESAYTDIRNYTWDLGCGGG